MAAIALADISLISTEPRVLDLVLARALEFARERDVRKLIERNTDELKQHGEICATVAQIKSDEANPKGAGRPSTEYWLNEAQALLIAMFARTPKAAAVRAQIIAVFTEWRRRQEGNDNKPVGCYHRGTGDDTPLHAFTPTLDTDAAPLTTRLALIKEARVLYGAGAARHMWRTLGLPEVPAPAPVATPADYRAAEARDCLDWLLEYPLVRTRAADEADYPAELAFPTSLRLVALTAAGNHLADWRRLCGAYGIRPAPERDGFLIANHAPMLDAVYGASRWANAQHMFALRHLPGAEVVGHPHRFASMLSRSVFVPAALFELS